MPEENSIRIFKAVIMKSKLDVNLPPKNKIFFPVEQNSLLDVGRQNHLEFSL